MYKTLENSLSYVIFFLNSRKKLEFTTPSAFLEGGGGCGRPPPPWIRHCIYIMASSCNLKNNSVEFLKGDATIPLGFC